MVLPGSRVGNPDSNPDMFMHRTGEAVDRGMRLCHDPVRLKGEVGTDIGELLMGMRSARGRQDR